MTAVLETIVSDLTVEELVRWIPNLVHPVVMVLLLTFVLPVHTKVVLPVLVLLETHRAAQLVAME